MMHKSDNFLAEQTLLMVSKRKLGHSIQALLLNICSTTTFLIFLPNQDGLMAAD
jgi:hypothetical protein